MIFGTQIGVAPGSLAMRLNGTMPQGPGTCPPDPVWRYFPSPFEPLNYTGYPNPPSTPPPPRQVISIEPPHRPGFDPVPPEPSTLPPPRPRSPAMTLEPSTPEPRTPVSMVPVSPRSGVFVPYGTESRLAGLGQPGPFGMTWGGFLSVIGVALAGGIGLGYLHHRRG